MIDLFAGCGGLSLGLEQAGFEPLLVSEISKDAMKTYLANRDVDKIKAMYDIYDLTDEKLDRNLNEWAVDIDLVAEDLPVRDIRELGIGEL